MDIFSSKNILDSLLLKYVGLSDILSKGLTDEGGHLCSTESHVLPIGFGGFPSRLINRACYRWEEYGKRVFVKDDKINTLFTYLF